VAVAGRGGKEGGSPDEEAGGAEIVGNGPAGDDVAAEGGGGSVCGIHICLKRNRNQSSLPAVLNSVMQVRVSPDACFV
jgi:hypothetical protein